MFCWLPLLKGSDPRTQKAVRGGGVGPEPFYTNSNWAHTFMDDPCFRDSFSMLRTERRKVPAGSVFPFLEGSFPHYVG